MSGVLRKREKTQHVLVGLGSAAFAVAVALPGKGGLNFPQGINTNGEYIFSDTSNSVKKENVAVREWGQPIVPEYGDISTGGF